MYIIFNQVCKIFNNFIEENIEYENKTLRYEILKIKKYLGEEEKTETVKKDSLIELNKLELMKRKTYMVRIINSVE
jgi:hypothetical protein